MNHDSTQPAVLDGWALLLQAMAYRVQSQVSRRRNTPGEIFNVHIS